MHQKYFLFLIPVAIMLASSCRPSSQDNFLYDNAGEPMQIRVTEQNRQITLRGPAGKKITRVKQLGISRNQTGRFTPAYSKKYVSLVNNAERNTYDIELTIDTNVSCKNSTTNGIALHNLSNFNISCVNETALVNQLKTACKELATDAATAEYDENRDTCNCVKRTTDKLLRYSDFFGRISTFKAECTNVATREQLKTICTEIKDRQCPTCVISQLSCECPKRVTLNFDEFLTKVDSFRSRCEEPNVLKPVDPTLTSAQQQEKFETECRRSGTLSTASTTLKSCTCTNGSIVGFENWQRDQDALNKSCRESLVLETNQEKVSLFEKSCVANDGFFNLNGTISGDPVCKCRNANTNVSNNEVSFRDFQLKGSTAIRNLCVLKISP